MEKLRFGGRMVILFLWGKQHGEKSRKGWSLNDSAKKEEKAFQEKAFIPQVLDRAWDGFSLICFDLS